MKKALLIVGILLMVLGLGCSGMWGRAQRRAGLLDSTCVDGVCHTLSRVYVTTTSCDALFCRAYVGGRVDIENTTDDYKVLHLNCTMIMHGRFAEIYDGHIYLGGGQSWRIELGRMADIVNAHHPGYLHCKLREVDEEE